MPEGGSAELEDTDDELSSSGSSLEDEEDSSELELSSGSSLEEDSSGSELEDCSLLDSGSTEELDSTTGSSEELVSTTSLEELDFAEEDVPGEAEDSTTEELLSSAEELLECLLCEELLLPDFFQTGRPSVVSHLARHFESARQESIMASKSDGPRSPNFSTATISSVPG